MLNKRQLPSKGPRSDGRTGASTGDVWNFSAVIMESRVVPSLAAGCLVGFSRALMHLALS